MKRTINLKTKNKPVLGNKPNRIFVNIRKVVHKLLMIFYEKLSPKFNKIIINVN